MAKKIMIAPSILSADFSRLGEEIRAVEKAGADWIHIDVMDGVFVPNITIGPCVVKSARPVSKIPFDVHLMIQNPLELVKPFAESGADIITFHIESCRDPRRTIAAIRECGKQVGVSIRPKTPLSELAPYLKDVDMVLVMSVEPGFSGQSFMPEALPKIESLKKIFDKHIEVDGGINLTTARQVAAAGATILVAGTAVFGESDYKKAIGRLRGE